MPASPTPDLDLRCDLDVLEAARRAAYEYIDPADSKKKSVPAVAARMGIPAGTLYNKLNMGEQESMHHKLTVRDLVLIVTITGDLRVLSALTHTFGCACFPLPSLDDVSDAALLEQVNNIGAQGGDFHRAINAALSGKRITPQAVALIQKEGFEYIAAILQTMARTKGLIDG